MTTKEKIVLAAVNMFNEKGYNTITTRHIAAEINISPGNLHYHFKHSDDIVIELFQRLEKEMDNHIMILRNSQENTVQSIQKHFSGVFETFYKYKFLFLNFTDILRKIPSIQENYAVLQIKRRIEFTNLFKMLQKQRILKEDIPEFIIDSLVTKLFIVGDNCISFNELTLKLGTTEAVSHHTKLYMTMFYPYLIKSQQENFSKTLNINNNNE